MFDPQVKLFAPILALLTTVVAALTLSSCARLRATQSNVTQASSTISPAGTQEESKPRMFNSDGEPFITDEVEIVSAEVVEKNSRLGYELDISYPQITKPKTSQTRSFNLHVRRHITNTVRDFRAFCSENRTHPNGTKRQIDYFLGADYGVLYSTQELLSINLTLRSFTGYVNEDYSPLALNFDLKTGRLLRLANLFKSEAKFLEAIATYSLNELEKGKISCGGTVDVQTLRKGTLPEAGNYEGWNLTRLGLQITFGEYQVGPGCLGLVKVVIPYSYLKELLRDKRLLGELNTSHQ
jgi:hypothetical protein